MKKDSRPPSIDDVARLAGVSISTVSRVVNRNVPVSSEISERVEAVMRELNYVPRPAARNLATHRTNTIGLLLSDVLGDFFRPLLTGIETVVRENGFDLLISLTGVTRPQDQRLRPFGLHNTDGLLIFAGSLTPEGLTQAHATGLPLVLLHQSPPAGLSIPCVTVENKAASRQLIEHLIVAHQRRRIVLLRGPENNEDARWRERGYREALAAHHIAVDSQLIGAGEFERHQAQAAIERMLAEEVSFDAVFAGDDEAAVGVLATLEAHSVRVPEEVAVVGFDDQRLAVILHPPLTTVRAPTEQVGREAARHLINLIRTGNAEPLTLLPTELVLRRSCGCG
ncbi:MAG TPA: LacI family DNA-binding transcriptional regulator [Anaerolineae bacterium]|nr:LacI family DNA-binding transcriptional regulator [Anaerolineae bacterium]